MGSASCTVPLKRYVALKTMDPALARKPKFRDRFFAEAENQARLSHPNIVTIYRFFEHAERFFIAMEYVEGESLPDGSRVRTLAELIRHGALPTTRLQALFSQVLDAVACAHEHGVLHRDLKPLNVLLTAKGAAKVADFGIAKVVGGGVSLTSSGASIGTPEYMSPEQVLDEELDRRSDIYSLGVMLYEMAVGALPFRATPKTPLRKQHLYSPPPAPRERAPGLPAGLERIILKALEKKPQDRFRSCEEMSEAQEGALSDSKKVVVPLSVGMTRSEAELVARQSGCELRTAGEDHSDSVPAGAVLRQTPEPGSLCPAAGTVEVVLSKGRREGSPGLRETIRDGSGSAVKADSQDRPWRFRWKWGRRLAAGLLVGIGAPLLVLFVVARLQDRARAGRLSGDAAFRVVGTNDKGYEEILWLKDSSVMMKVPAGTFTMGSNHGEPGEEPVHQVYLDEYYIDKYEVTNRQYKRFCDATGRSYPSDPDFPGMSRYFTRHPDYPVVNVSWEDAKAYCGWAGKRLPTEAEWERAARGVYAVKYPWGNSEPNAGGSYRANYDPGSASYTEDGYARTAPVGSFPAGASPYGCMDMAGNVWEWCSDWYGEYSASTSSSPSRNPEGPSSGSVRVFRGGSWFVDAWGLSCALRVGGEPSGRVSILGFRCVRSE